MVGHTRSIAAEEVLVFVVGKTIIHIGIHISGYGFVYYRYTFLGLIYISEERCAYC
ncbi:MAG TPA: hypothetical protein VIS28_04825 [Nitrososphaeraceae archaeon]|jgi:hypothetical protein